MSSNADYPRTGFAQAAAARSLWRGVGLVLLVNGLLAAWLLIKPASPAVFGAVDNVAQCVGLLLGVPLCFLGAGWPWRWAARAGTGHPPAPAARQWGPTLLAVGIFSEAVGQGIYTFYEQVLHQPAPFPSWADAAFLSAIPFLLLGILLLPTRPIPLAARTRVLMDGLMIMTATVTFSWYFILGPTMLQGADSALAKIVGVAYPLCDLVLIFCLLLLSARSGDAALRRAVRILSLALVIIVATDSMLDYLTLQNAYATGGLLDVGWPLGYMLVGLGAGAARLGMAGQAAADRAPANEASAEAPRVWRSLLPYALVPAVGGLLLYTWHTHANVTLQRGVYIGGALLIGLILLRQVLAILENTQLYRRLDDAYRQTVAYAESTEQLNEELRAMHSELESNNQALTEANARLQALATTDPLTGLPNHRAVVAALDQELERARRYNRGFALVFLDLDHFKALNDGYGHPVGDAVLCDFAAVVRRTLRGIDVLGRWGGEEFIVLLPETEQEGALAIAERVRAAVAAHTFSAGGGSRLTCSLGLALYPHDAEDRDGLVGAADRAMYAAKHLGRNQVRAASDPAVAALDGETDKAGSREETALVGTVEALAALVEARDHYTGQHTLAVSALTVRLALALGLDSAEARMVGLAGRLHDVGKIAVPDAILQKPARLTDEEWALMRTHPAVGADVVGRVPALRMLAPLIRAHHERWDGQGYPEGLAAEDIPLGARIVAVADAYGAMISDRPYRQACSSAQALAELRRCAGTQFDPSVVAALEQVLAADAPPADHTQAA